MSSKQEKHPIQPLISDEHGTTRFKANSIVRLLLDSGPFDMNDLARQGFSDDDFVQFAQLIGYSLSGFSELSFVSDEYYDVAVKVSRGQDPRDAEIAALQTRLGDTRDVLRQIVPRLFRIHPDDMIE